MANVLLAVSCRWAAAVVASLTLTTRFSSVRRDIRRACDKLLAGPLGGGDSKRPGAGKGLRRHCGQPHRGKPMFVRCSGGDWYVPLARPLASKCL